MGGIRDARHPPRGESRPGNKSLAMKKFTFQEGKTINIISVRRERAKPGTSGTGKCYHLEVRPRTEFTTFRTQDVGKKGGIQRIAGKRSSGSWDTKKWLIPPRFHS